MPLHFRNDFSPPGVCAIIDLFLDSFLLTSVSTTTPTSSIYYSLRFKLDLRSWDRWMSSKNHISWYPFRIDFPDSWILHWCYEGFQDRMWYSEWRLAASTMFARVLVALASLYRSKIVHYIIVSYTYIILSLTRRRNGVLVDECDPVLKSLKVFVFWQCPRNPIPNAPVKVVTRNILNIIFKATRVLWVEIFFVLEPAKGVECLFRGHAIMGIYQWSLEGFSRFASTYCEEARFWFSLELL